MRLTIFATLLALPGHTLADLNHCVSREGKTLVTDGACPVGSVKKRITSPAALLPKDRGNKPTIPPSPQANPVDSNTPPSSTKRMQY